MLGKEEWGVPGNSGYCILMLGTKMKEERSKILWNKITNCWNLQEAVNFEYRRRMPTVSPMCHEWHGTMAVKHIDIMSLYVLIYQTFKKRQQLSDVNT
jgi:hypothetical protein